MTSRRLRIAVLFDNLGPYHVARLSALSALCDLLALEQYERSNEYAWSPTSSVCFRRVTLSTSAAGTAAKTSRELIRSSNNVLSKFQPDVVVVPGWASEQAISAVIWAVEREVPVVVMSDSQELDFPRTWVREWIKRQFLGCCDGGIVGGVPHRNYLLKLGMDASRVRVGYAAVGNEFFSAETALVRQDQLALRQLHRLPKRYVLASARFVEKKNLPFLLQAFARFVGQADRFAAESDHWHLVIIGDGELRATLEQKVSELGLGSRVHMPGFMQYHELPLYFGLANFFVLSSTTEQWGLVVNEAMASGLPVLVSNRCGCASDLVKAGVNGYTFDPYDVGDLCEKLIHMSKSETSLRSMGKSSEELIRANAPAVFARNLVELSKSLLGLPRPKVSWFDRLLLFLMLLWARRSTE